MNALAACKVVLRGLPDTAEPVLPLGFGRIDEPDRSGDRSRRIAALADAAASRDPQLRELAACIRAVVLGPVLTVPL